MRTKLIASLLASGCLVALQGGAVAQDLNEHPSVSTPDQARQNPAAASQFKDRQALPANNGDLTGRPAPGPHESGH